MNGTARADGTDAATRTPQPPATVAAPMKVAGSFSDGMVLQRDVAVPIWGTAAPDAEIVVEFAGQRKTARADGTGAWVVKLDPLSASAENRVLTVTGGSAKVAFSKVLVGEVWLCSGGLNMDQGLFDYSPLRPGKTLPDTDYPLVRIRYTAKISPIKLLPHDKGSPWRECSLENLKQGHMNGFSALAFLFARELHKKLNVPVGVIQSTYHAARIEPWTPPEGFKQVPGLESLARRPRVSHYNERITLYNGMIYPLIPYAFRGVIWHQGENGLGDEEYGKKMFALIRGWRTAWKQGDFPFYFVQLAQSGISSQMPRMWEEQTKALALPNTGMVVTHDISDRQNDYLKVDKQVIAERLTRLALSRIHGEKFTDDTGPLFESARIEADGKKIIIEFTHVNSGLHTRDKAPPTHFEVAAKDGVFHPATAVIVEGKRVELTCDSLVSLQQMRFAWQANARPNLINGEKLPAGAFRWPVAQDEGAGKTH